ncbi:tail fiber domain-containing protein [Brevundimonas sp.]|uniref:tail fiber domain-containing protein n=1 Tax=Brevundimonas sp. TaxID=1871086 RepID=UPI0022BBD4BB|nr:tail fiber domain-containing protein [Brevundimonas sp.]MCZ8192969.1 tail fiber domain-containing protein [Brevundimonas sp.]
MPNTLRHKRSTAPGGVPTTAALSLGELAINTYDGKLYLKKNVSGSETVVEVGAVTSGGVTAALGYTPANKAGESFTGAISVAGSITATGDVTAYSDASLKTGVVTIADALDLVRQMRGVRYQRLDTGATGIGVIAQELRVVVPELVAENDDGLLSVAYGNLVGVLIEAVKELAAKVESLGGHP